MPVDSSSKNLFHNRTGKGEWAELTMKKTQTENSPDITENIHSPFRTIAGIRAVVALARAGHREERLVIGVRLFTGWLFFNVLAVFFQDFDCFGNSHLA